MRNLGTKASVGFGLVLALVVGWATASFAAADTAVTGLATTSANSLKENFLAVMLIVVPIAVGVLLIKKALPIAKKTLHIG